MGRPWQGYYINHRGYYIPFPVPKGSYPIATNANENVVPCDPWASEMVARCISVIDPNKPRTIWLGFSDTQWTDDVLKENEQEAVRDRHMTRFDLGQWWSTGSHPNACPLDECDKHIMDMAAEVNRKAFEFSPAPIPNPRIAHDAQTLAALTGVKLHYPLSTAQLAEIFQKIPFIKDPEQRAKAEALRGSPSTPKDSLLRAAERMLGAENKHKAAVVAINDPVGILMDLSIYIDYRAEKYVSGEFAKKYERQITIGGIIKNIEAGIKSGTKEFWTEETPKFEKKELPWYEKITYIGAETTEYQQRSEAYKKDPKLLEKAIDAQWEKYGKKIDPTKMKAAEQAFEADLKAFDQDHILPLVKGYVSWFQGKSFTASMECNHDPCDMNSGLSYATIVSLCLGSLQDKTPINEEIIVKQLNAGMLDKTNVLSRALVLNQDSEARKVQAAIDQKAGGLDLKTQLEFWKGVIAQSGAAVSAVSKTRICSMRAIPSSPASRPRWAAALSVQQTPLSRSGQSLPGW